MWSQGVGHNLGNGQQQKKMGKVMTRDRKKVKSLSCVQLFVTPWTVAHQAPLSRGFSRQEYWSGLPFPSPGHLPDPGIEPKSLMSPALEGGFFTIEPLGKSQHDD